MWKKILISGAVGAVILGAGGTALAASGDSSPSPASHSGHQKAKDKAGASLRHALHGTYVTKGDDGKFVTHDVIRGIVTALSSSAASPSITVKAADPTSETYVVTPSTKVHVKGDKTGGIGAVEVGDTVGVVGTGTSTLTATYIIDRGKPSATTPTS